MTHESPRPATQDQLRWLNNGFDNGAIEKLETRYLQRATTPSGTPPPWIFVEADPSELDISAT